MEVEGEKQYGESFVIGTQEKLLMLGEDTVNQVFVPVMCFYSRCSWLRPGSASPGPCSCQANFCLHNDHALWTLHKPVSLKHNRHGDGPTPHSSLSLS